MSTRIWCYQYSGLIHIFPIREPPLMPSPTVHSLYYKAPSLPHQPPGRKQSHLPCLCPLPNVAAGNQSIVRLKYLHPTSVPTPMVPLRRRHTTITPPCQPLEKRLAGCMRAEVRCASHRQLRGSPQICHAALSWRDRKSTRLNSSHSGESRMPSSA